MAYETRTERVRKVAQKGVAKSAQAASDGAAKVAQTLGETGTKSKSAVKKRAGGVRVRKGRKVTELTIRTEVSPGPMTLEEAAWRVSKMMKVERPELVRKQDLANDALRTAEEHWRWCLGWEEPYTAEQAEEMAYALTEKREAEARLNTITSDIYAFDNAVNHLMAGGTITMEDYREIYRPPSGI